MNTPLRVVGFVAALAAVFGAALVVGKAVGPVAGPAPGDDGGHGGSAHETKSKSSSTQFPQGLMTSQNGFTLRLAEDSAEPGRDIPVSFAIEGPEGEPVEAYDVEHEKQLHLIAVRRDFNGFQHVHPRLDADGVWSSDLDLTPGQWRLFADFKAKGAKAVTLGTDLSVSGEYQPSKDADEVRTSKVGDYTVTLEGRLLPGTDSKLTLSVARNGKPITDLEPYLGAFGHLVALRKGDLAYLHVHPEGTPGDGKTDPGPGVVFFAAVPSKDSYRLYLDFKHDGVVRTASFAVDASDAEAGKEQEHTDEH